MLLKWIAVNVITNTLVIFKSTLLPALPSPPPPPPPYPPLGGCAGVRVCGDLQGRGVGSPHPRLHTGDRQDLAAAHSYTMFFHSFYADVF